MSSRSRQLFVNGPKSEPRDSTSRREFLAAGVLAAGLALTARSARAASASAGPEAKPQASSKSLRILILGGTGFLGPALLDAARARGHTVTLFNRGKTEKRKPHQFDDVEKLYGNRDPKLRADDADSDSPQGLSSLEGRSWDAAIDTSGYVPRVVKASAEALRERIKHYTFISTISVYASNATANQNESAAIAQIDDPSVESMGAQQQNYGPLKALCELAAEAAMPGRVLNIRPGFIVGPNDPTDRFTYWPVRAAGPAGYASDMLVPGDGSEPVQFIDVRDLAEWIIRSIESNTTGTFNATGPSTPTSFKSVIAACLAAAEASGAKAARPIFVPWEVLEKQHVSIGGDLPIWIPPIGEYAGFHQRDCSKAIKTGLTFRPTVDTCKALLAWWPIELQRRITVTAQMMNDAKNAGKPAPNMPDPNTMRVGMAPEREAEVLAAWSAAQSAPKSAPTPTPTSP